MTRCQKAKICYCKGKEDYSYKKNGSALALYPTPTVVVGAMNGDKPTWTLVGHVGIIGHDKILVSLASAHFINPLIKKNGKLSVSIGDEGMLPGRSTTTPSNRYCLSSPPMSM